MFWSLKRSVTLPSSKPSGKPTLTRLGGSVSTLGKRKRRVPRDIRAIEALKVAQARPNGDRNSLARKFRRSGLLAAGLAAGLAAAGARAAGLPGVAGVGSAMVTNLEGRMSESSSASGNFVVPRGGLS